MKKPSHDADTGLKQSPEEAEGSVMLPNSFMQGLAMFFVGAGGVGSAQVALLGDQPILALGFVLGAIIFLGSGVVRMVRATP